MSDVICLARHHKLKLNSQKMYIFICFWLCVLTIYYVSRKNFNASGWFESVVWQSLKSWKLFKWNAKTCRYMCFRLVRRVLLPDYVRCTYSTSSVTAIEINNKKNVKEKTNWKLIKFNLPNLSLTPQWPNIQMHFRFLPHPHEMLQLSKTYN